MELARAADGGSRVHVVMRHGARSASEGALRPFAGSALALAWSDAELERVTALGLAQCRTVGRHLVAAGGALAAAARGGVRWHSSKVERVVESGRAFLEGAAEGGGVGLEQASALLRQGPAALSRGGLACDQDVFYRAYLADKEYVAAARRLRDGELFRDRAQREQAVLSALRPAPSAAPGSAQQLDATTYVEELLECERFWQGTHKRALRDANDAHLLHAVGRLARWCWDQRFFQLPEARRLGVPLLEAIKADLFGAERHAPQLVLHSAHDYTIMALLAALGVEAYPPETLGFASYLVFTAHGVVLNACPFTDIDLRMQTDHETTLQWPSPYETRAERTALQPRTRDEN
jgi:hypothetical protein